MLAIACIVRAKIQSVIAGEQLRCMDHQSHSLLFLQHLIEVHLQVGSCESRSRLTSEHALTTQDLSRQRRQFRKIHDDSPTCSERS